MIKNRQHNNFCHNELTQRFTCISCERSPVIKKWLNNETFKIHHRGTRAQSEETQLKRLRLTSAQTAVRASGQLTLSVFLVTVAVQLEKMMRCSAESVETFVIASVLVGFLLLLQPFMGRGLSRAAITAGLNTTAAPLPVRLTLLNETSALPDGWCCLWASVHRTAEPACSWPKAS